MKDIKQIRRRRLALIGIVFLLLCGGGYTLWVVQASIRAERRDRRVAEMVRLAREGEAVLDGTRPDDRARVESNFAKAADDYNIEPELTYTTVLELYRQHLDETNDADTALLEHFAELRESVVTSGGRHLHDARAAWLRLSAQRPDDPEVQRNLARLTRRVADPKSALPYARRAVELAPRDPEAAELLVSILTQARDYPAAEQAAAEARQRMPNHLPLLRRQLEAMILDGRTEEAKAVAEAAADAFEPTNPRGLVAESVAAMFSEDWQRSSQALLKATLVAPPDQQYVDDLLTQLDMTRRFAAARKYLADHPAEGPGHPRFIERARRLFEADRLAQAKALLDEFRFDELPLELRVVRVLIEHRGGDAAQAADWVRTLAASSHPLDAAWGQLLALNAADGEVSEEQVSAAQDAVRMTDRHPYAMAIAADAMARAGTPDQAVPFYDLAARARRPWVQPHEQLARLHFEAERFKPALDHAQLAQLAAPHKLMPKYLRLLAGARALGDDNRDGLLELLALAEEFPKQYVPDEQWERITELKVELLARTGQGDAAAEAVTAYLDQDPPPSAGSLARLARLDREHGLGLGEAIFERSRQRYGLSLEMVVERALAEHRGGRTDAGLKLLRDAADAADDPMPWRIAIAKYREAVDDPAAMAAWRALGEQFADQPTAQRALLSSGLPWRDPALVTAALERVKAAGLGDEPDVRRHRVRALLMDGSPAALAEARPLVEAMVAEQPGSAVARGFDAALHEARGQLDEAAEALRRAVDLSGGEPTYRLDLARVQQRRRAFAVAREQLRLVVGDPNAAGPYRLAAAQLMAAQGDTLPAIEALESLRRASPDPEPQRDRLLAELYNRAGRHADAERLLTALLDAPTPDLLLQAAMLQAGRGQIDAALATLGRLEETGADAAEQARVRAQFHTRFSPPAEALSHLETALAAAPDSPGLWRTLTLLRLTHDGPAAAADAAARAAEAVSSPAGFEAFTRAVAEAGEAAARSDLMPLLRLAMDDPSAAPAVGEAFAAIQPLLDRQTDAATAAATARKIEAIAARHGDPIELHQLAVQLLISSRQFDAAADKAQALSATYPGSGSVAKLAAAALRSAGRWDDAVVAAERWSRLEPGAEPSAAAVVAEARLQQNAPEAALEALRPHVELALASPAKHEDVIAAYVKTLARTGRAREAAVLLQPLCEASGAWRALALRVATDYAAPNPSHATAVLEAATAALPDDHPGELLDAAKAWEAVGRRFSDRAALDRAVSLGRQAVDAADTAGDAARATMWFHYAGIAETAGDTAAAEQGYRRSIELGDASGAAANNLAMLLSQDRARLDEAVTLAEKAVADDPTEPNYLDTLALVRLARGEHDQALAAIDRAIELQPDAALWRETRAKIVAAAGSEG